MNTNELIEALDAEIATLKHQGDIGKAMEELQRPGADAAR
jgi:hypothetical protein